MPFSPLYFLFFLFILSVMMGIIQYGLISLTLSKLGLSPTYALLLFSCSLMGSLVNIPLFKIQTGLTKADIIPQPYGLLRHMQREFTGETIIAINIGGAIIPILFSIYLVFHSHLNLFQVAIGITLISIISYYISRPIMGLGIGMPILVAPVSAAIVAIIINVEQSAPLAYISGTMGVLIGADLCRLKDVKKLGTPLGSIGGAGTFDGIFLTGLIAVLLT